MCSAGERPHRVPSREAFRAEPGGHSGSCPGPFDPRCPPTQQASLPPLAQEEGGFQTSLAKGALKFPELGLPWRPALSPRTLRPLWKV